MLGGGGNREFRGQTATRIARSVRDHPLISKKIFVHMVAYCQPRCAGLDKR